MVAVSLAKQDALSQSELRQLLKYDPETGNLSWLDSRHGAVEIGSTAGTLDHNGYVIIRINYQAYRAHRLIWLMVTGKWPEGDIDHRDECKSNNRWINLRDSTRTENFGNISSPKTNNRSGVRGVYWHAGNQKWLAQIRKNKQRYLLGYFDDLATAAKARREGELLHYGEFAPNRLAKGA